LKDACAARAGFRGWLFAVGGVFVVLLLAAGSTRLSDAAPYHMTFAGGGEVIPMVSPNLGMRHAAYRLFGERKQDEDAPEAHPPLMVTSVCLTTQDGFSRPRLVCSVRDPAVRRAAVVTTARVGRIR
jgi:hypothetical protein